MRISTQAYLIRNDEWLMLLRNKKKQDVNEGKWIGVGGKLEQGETPRECIKREIQEETGLTVKDVVYNGILYFNYEDQESEKIYCYTAYDWEGELIECNEGTLAWIKEADILNLSLWEGDRIYLTEMLKDKHSVFTLDLFYDKEGNLTGANSRDAENE